MIRAIWIGGRIRGVVAVSDGDGGCRLGDCLLSADRTFDSARRGRHQANRSRAVWNIKLPADPDKRVTLAQQKSIAHALVGLDAVVEHPQQSTAAAVRDLEENRAIGARGFARLEDVD